jgi:DNA polymerase-3 subunit gamma/tau
MELYKAYRPKTLEEVRGNKGTKASLEKFMRTESMPHTILFQGPHGCGKTTLARIVAEHLECPPELEDGSSNQDFFEIDAGTDRGIDTAREVKNLSMYRPIRSGARVFIYDEAQGLTEPASRALLKTLEDGAPDWAYFILCTTEPFKIPKTIKSRCTIFEVNLLTDSEISKLLSWVLEEEGAKVPVKMIKDIVKVADGHARDALVLLDQIIDLDEDQMEDAIRSAEIREKAVLDLCRAVFNRDPWEQTGKILKDLQEEPERVRQAILGYASSVLMKEPDEKAAKKSMLIWEAFRDPFHYNGRAGLIFSCFEVCGEEQDIPF